MHHSRDFWNLLKVPPARVAASIADLHAHFSAYFGIQDADPLPTVVRDYLSLADHVPFSRAEVLEGLALMQRGKTCGVALYSVDLLRSA